MTWKMFPRLQNAALSRCSFAYLSSPTRSASIPFYRMNVSHSTLSVPTMIFRNKTVPVFVVLFKACSVHFLRDWYLAYAKVSGEDVSWKKTNT